MTRRNVKQRSGRFLGAFLALIFLTIGAATAADWPQFQGPTRDGASTETGLAREWPEGGPKVLWRIETGVGYGGAAIEAGRVYFMDRIGKESDALRCLDLETGKEEWRFTYDAPGKLNHDGSRGTPSVDDKRVYVVGPFGHFHCLDKKTRKAVWSANLIKDFPGNKLPYWGISQAPLLYKDTVIVAPQAPRTGVVAFDRATGKIAWKSRGMLAGQGYVSPSKVTIDGVDQIVMVASGMMTLRGKSVKDPKPGEVAGFSAADGSELWSYRNWHCAIPIPYVTPLGDGRLFITGEYGAGSAMVRIVRKGEGFEVEEIYKTDQIGSQIQQPLLYKGHFYADSNGNMRKDGLLCLTLEGKRLWRTRDIKGAPRFDRGSILLADSMIYAIDAKGTLRLIDPNPEGYKELASAPMLGGKDIWSPMALSDGKLVIRDHTQMKCLDIRKR